MINTQVAFLSKQNIAQCLGRVQVSILIINLLFYAWLIIELFPFDNCSFFMLYLKKKLSLSLCSYFAASINKGRTVRGVSDAAEKLANMTIGSRRQSVGQLLKAPPMKTGVEWNTESGGDMFLRSNQPLQPGRSYTRKVAG